jgi:probable addiction module antidote protein
MKFHDFDNIIEQELTDPQFAQGYLQEALDEGGIPLFLLALRHLVQAQQGFSNLAQETGLGRESLYKSLSENGNPQLVTIDKVLKSLGMKISIVPYEPVDNTCL